MHGNDGKAVLGEASSQHVLTFYLSYFPISFSNFTYTAVDRTIRTAVSNVGCSTTPEPVLLESILETDSAGIRADFFGCQKREVL